METSHQQDVPTAPVIPTEEDFLQKYKDYLEAQIKDCYEERWSTSCLEGGNLSISGFEDQGVSPNMKLGKKLLKEGCELDNAICCGLLADIYKTENKKQKEQDYWMEAERLFLRGCRKWNSGNCLALAMGYSAHETDPEKRASIEHYLLKSCSLENATACQLLGSFYATPPKLDENKKLFYYAKSCALDNESACKFLADHFKQDNQPARATQFYKEACYLGNMESCLVLASNYLEAKKYQKSFDLADRACFFANLPEACFVAGKAKIALGSPVTESDPLILRGCKLQNFSSPICQGVAKQ